MKNFKILLFAVTVSLFTACNDAIDIVQPSELLPEVAFQSVEDMQLGLNGVYGAASGEDGIYFTSLFTDEVKLGIANGGQGRNGELAFLLNPGSSDANSIWLNNYRLINYANRLIAGAASVTPTDEQLEEYNDILAQTYALRAYGHFMLMQYFSEDMTNDAALGVIALDFVPDITQKLQRNTNAEVYALINSDLDFAEANLLTDTPDSSNQRAYISKTFLTGLRARMAVYREKYDEAATYLTDALLTQSGIRLVARGPATSNYVNGAYFKMFQDNYTTTEVIWALGRTATNIGNFYQYWSSVNSTTSGSPFFEVSSSLFNLVDNATDGRRSVIVDVSAAPSFDVRPVGKYSITESINLLGDIKVMRTSELYFLRAEIAANAGDLAGVANYVNAVRRARNNTAVTGTVGTLDVPANATDAWRMILTERRIELAFEGFRYVDLRRLGPKANVTVDRTQADYAFNQVYTLPIDDHRWILPIPLNEIQANPSIQQNPGY